MATERVWARNLPTVAKGKALDVLRGRLQTVTEHGTVMALDAEGRTSSDPMFGSVGGKRATRQQKLNAVVGTAFKPKEYDTDRQLKKNSNKTYRIRFEGIETNNASMEDREFYESLEYDMSFPVNSTVIKSIEYNSKERVLKVGFSDREVRYGGVPLSIYEQLYYAQTSGKSVNATFWNLVRVYERRNLPMPLAQADPESWADYYPKSSNFKREGSKFQFMRDYAISDSVRGVGREAQAKRDEQDKADTYAAVRQNVEALKRQREAERLGYSTDHVVDALSTQGLTEKAAPQRIREKKERPMPTLPDGTPNWIKDQLIALDNEMGRSTPWAERKRALEKEGRYLLNQFMQKNRRENRGQS